MSTVELVFRSDVTVDVIDHMASDAAVVRAARVSTLGDGSRDAEADEGLIRYLMRNRHGTPFEHAVFTFYAEVPLVVAREWQRHRIASYNEESGRYRELRPVFYLPDMTRPLVQVGKVSEYQYDWGSVEQYDMVADQFRRIASDAYAAYRAMLDAGVAREVARMVLPLSTFTSFYFTVNARSLMNYLSLRTRDERSCYPSFPMWEIEMCADQIEAHFERLMPITHAAFNESGRVAP